MSAALSQYFFVYDLSSASQNERSSNTSHPDSTLQTRRGGVLPLVPVRSSESLPKGMLLAAAARLRQVVLEAPVREHQMVIKNVLSTGVDIITSRDLCEARV